MKQIAKMTATLLVLLAVSACSVSGSSEVFESYDYNPADSLGTIYQLN
jgi:hypothetical protein